MKRLRLNEKIMIGVLVISLIGFLAAPCCWNQAHRMGAKHAIECASNTTASNDSRQQENKQVHNSNDEGR